MIFKKNLTACLLEVSRLINSAINKRQGDQRKHSFLEKKKMHKKENRFIMNTQKYQDTVDWSHLLKKSLMENFIFCPVIRNWWLMRSLSNSALEFRLLSRNVRKCIWNPHSHPIHHAQFLKLIVWSQNDKIGAGIITLNN